MIGFLISVNCKSIQFRNSTLDIFPDWKHAHWHETSVRVSLFSGVSVLSRYKWSLLFFVSWIYQNKESLVTYLVSAHLRSRYSFPYLVRFLASMLCAVHMHQYFARSDCEQDRSILCSLLIHSISMLLLNDSVAIF